MNPYEQVGLQYFETQTAQKKKREGWNWGESIRTKADITKEQDEEEIKKAQREIQNAQIQAAKHAQIDKGLDMGMSWEDIAGGLGIDANEVKEYSETTRPEYGKDTRSNVNKLFDTINPIDSGRSWGRSTPSAEGAEQSAFSQLKGTGGKIFSGLEKVGDSVEALTGITDRRMKHWDEELRKGNITPQLYQKLLEQQQKDTEWAGTEDKGILNRLKTAGGVGLEATSEIVPFLKGAKALEMTAKGGAAIGAGLGLAHGTGSELNNPEGFNISNVALETAVGGIGGAVLGKFAQSGQEAKQFVKNYQTRRILDTLDEAPDAIQPITDTSRLLSATTTSRVQQLTGALDSINKQLDEAASGTGVNTSFKPKQKTMRTLGSKPTSTTTPKTTKAGNPDMRTTAAKRQGTVTLEKTRPDLKNSGKSLRGLVQQKEEIMRQLDEIESGAPALEDVSRINDELSSKIASGNASPDEINKLMVERQTVLQAAKENPSPVAQANTAFVEENANTALRNQALLDPTTPELATPTAAKRAAGKQPVTSVYEKLPDEVQALNYAALKESNPEIIDQIAAGAVDGRQYGFANEYAAAMQANDAIANKNVKAIKEIANSDVFTGASIKGQDISSLRHLDARSPVRSIKTITKARKAAKASGRKIVGDITDGEAEQILTRYNRMQRLRAELDESFSAGKLDNKKRMEYGQAVVNHDKYITSLLPSKTAKEWVKHPWGAAMDIAGTTKSLRATADLSATLRQGAKLLGSGKYKIWGKNTYKALKAAVKSFGDEAVMDMHNADMVSRPNFLNGMYKKMDIPVYDVIEEAFPSKSLDKVPILRKLYNASDTAYTVFTQGARADLADAYIDKAMKAGVDLSKEGKAIGSLVNSLSSRASLGRAEGKVANVVNNVFFSPRMLKSNIDVLGGHVITGGGGIRPISAGSNFVRKEAAKNLLKIAATTYGILKIADQVRPGSVEWDPKSSNYGKIKVGNTRFDVTGGMSSLVTLGRRLQSGSTKSSTTDIESELNDPENRFSQTTMSVLSNFTENKLSPTAAALLDWVQGEDISGKKPTVGSTLRNLTVPIIVDNYEELAKDKNAAPLLASMILEGLGVSTNTYDIKDDWEVKPSQAQKGFRANVSKEKFKQANEEYNQMFTDWFRETRYSKDYKSMPMKDRKKLLSDAGDDLEKQIMQKYGYIYKAEKKPKSQNEDLINSLNAFYKR